MMPPAQAPNTFGVRATGDVARDLDSFLARADVGVEVPVPLRGRGVAPAHSEVRHACRDGVLDEAAPGRNVGDVELVDLRRDRDERSRKRHVATSCVLDEFEDVAAMDDRARGDREVLTDGERSRIDRRRHPAVVAHVVGEVPESGDQAAATGLESFS